MTLVDWTTVRSADAHFDDRTLGLIPLGALEQHGPHLPLITDALIADALARRVAVALEPPIVVGPVLPAGLSDHHLAFPGTVTLTAEIFEGLLSAYVAALRRMGICDVAIFSAHGGNFEFIAHFVLRHAQSGIRLRGYSDLLRYLATMREGAARTSVVVGESDVHAGGLETSQMLYLRPDLVGDYRSVAGYTAAEPGWLKTLLSEGARALSPIGVLGDPRVATPEAGAAIFDALCDELVAWITGEFEWVRLVPTPAVEAELVEDA